MQLFVELTNQQTGEEEIIGLAHIRRIRKDEEGRAVVWLSDSPDDQPFLATDSYKSLREKLRPAHLLEAARKR